MVGIGVGYSQSSNSARSQDFVFKPQAKALGQMYKDANSTYQGQQGLMNQFQNFGMNTVNPYLAGLNPYMMQGFGGLMSGGQAGQFNQQMNPQLQQSLTNSLNGQQGPTQSQRMYQDIIGGEGNSYIDPVVDDMYANAWKGLDRGGFKDNAQRAAQSGNMGNYNRQMDNSLLAADTMSDVRSKEMALRAGAYDTDMNWKMDLANAADTNVSNERMQAQQGLMGMQGAGDANTQFGINSGAAMQQMGLNMMNPWMAMQQMPWNAINNWSNALGDPTVLNANNSSGSSYGGSASIGV